MHYSIGSMNPFLRGDIALCSISVPNSTTELGILCRKIQTDRFEI